MRRTTIFADDDLINEIKEISKEENRSVAEIVRDAMQNYIKQKRHKKEEIVFYRHRQQRQERYCRKT